MCDTYTSTDVMLQFQDLRTQIHTLEPNEPYSYRFTFDVCDHSDDTSQSSHTTDMNLMLTVFGENTNRDNVYVFFFDHENLRFTCVYVYNMDMCL